MASGAASTSSASQPATSPSPMSGSPQAPSDAPRVADVQERRQAFDGGWYTEEEFREYYETPYGTKWVGNWRRFWDQAVREADASMAPRVEPAAVSAASTAEPAGSEESGRGSWLVEAGKEHCAFQRDETVVSPKAKAAPTPGQLAEWRNNASQAKRRFMNEAMLIMSAEVEDKKRIDAVLRDLREGAREAAPPGAVSARGACQPATDASSIGGTSLAPSGAPLVEHEQENKETEGKAIIEEFLQAICPADKQAVLVGADARAGERTAALCEELCALNEKMLEGACANQAHLSDAWECISQRLRDAAGRDGSQRDLRSLCNGTHAGEPAVTAGTADAFQPGVEFSEVTRRQDKRTCSVTEEERVAAVFMELGKQNKKFLENVIAQREQQIEAWQKESKGRERISNDLDQAFGRAILRLEQRWGATHATQGLLLTGSWV